MELVMVRVQVEAVPAAAQSPLQAVKVAPPLGMAVRVTVVPDAKDALHVPGQLIPAGLLVTVPLPTTETEREKAETNPTWAIHVPHVVELAAYSPRSQKLPSLGSRLMPR